jgi:hypothetical protein
MTDFPAPGALPLHVTSFSRHGPALAVHAINGTTAAGSMTWVANQAVYMPFSIPWPYPVRRVFWINGSTIGSNVDFGIYTLSGTQLFHTGSTAQSGTSAAQYVAPATPFILAPGAYYFALNCDGTTNRLVGNTASAGTNAGLAGLLSQAVGAIALPATATFATYVTPGLPFCGITRTASGF